MVALSAKVAHFFQFFLFRYSGRFAGSMGGEKKAASVSDIIGSGRAVSCLQAASSDILKKA